MQSPGLGFICQFFRNGVHPVKTVTMDAANVKSKVARNVNKSFRAKGSFSISRVSRSRTAIFALHRLFDMSATRKALALKTFHTHLQIRSDLVQRMSLLPVAILSFAELCLPSISSRRVDGDSADDC